MIIAPNFKTSIMKNLHLIIVFFFLLSSCHSYKKAVTHKNTEKPVVIANEELAYEIIIFDTGFESYLNSIAKPLRFYSESYLETKNRFYVQKWNERAQLPLQYNSAIYENVIDYNFNIHYGLEVNYKLYNYFNFVTYKYGEKF